MINFEKIRKSLSNMKSFFNYYLCSSIINAGISFLIIAYMSHKISSAEFVLLGVVTALLGFVGSIIGFQTRSYVLFISSKHIGFNENDLVNIISSIFWMLVSFAAVGFVLSLVDISQYFDSQTLYLVLKCAATQWLYYLILIILQSKNLEKYYFCTIILSSITSTIYIVCVSSMGILSWEDRLLGLMFGFLTSPIILLYKHNNLNIQKSVFNLEFSSVVKSLKNSILYSAPLVPYSLSITSIVFFERYIASKNLVTTEAAQFLALAQLILIYGIMAESIYKKCQRSYLKFGKYNELITASKLVLGAGVGYFFIGQIIFDFIFPDHISFNLMLFLLMMLSAFLIFIIKTISLVFNFHQINTSLAKYTVFFNVCGLVIMNYLSSMHGVLFIPISLIITNLVLITLLLFKIKRIYND